MSCILDLRLWIKNYDKKKLGSNFQVPLSFEEEGVAFFPKKKRTKLEKGIKLP
jgi:hypothetical protein